MQISKIWSVSDERIRVFFQGQDDVRQYENDSFEYKQCNIRITALPLRRVSHFCFPQTLVEFSGPEPDTEEIHKRFVLNFISAGG